MLKGLVPPYYRHELHILRAIVLVNVEETAGCLRMAISQIFVQETV